MGKKIMFKLEMFFDKYLGGHITIGNITIYGHNAMHWGINIISKKYGYICFRLPLPTFYSRISFPPLYFYLSPNATPWASTFMLGKKNKKEDWAKSRLRYYYLGHNFNTCDEKEKLKLIREFYPYMGGD